MGPSRSYLESNKNRTEIDVGFVGGAGSCITAPVGDTIQLFDLSLVYMDRGKLLADV